jgi:hypothetical protein
MFIGVVGGTLAPEVFKYSNSRALTVVILGYIGAGTFPPAFHGQLIPLTDRRWVLHRPPKAVGLDDPQDGIWPRATVCSLPRDRCNLKRQTADL